MRLPVIIGILNTQLSEAEKKFLYKYRPIGVLLLGRNFDRDCPAWKTTLKDLIDSIYDAINDKDVLITLDHEGGRVHRTPPPVTHFPAAREYRENAYETGLKMAQELKEIGCNLSWAPVCDVDSNIDNPVIGTRSFSSIPEEAGEFAVKMLNGLHDGQLLCSAKHFPGHGDTTVDSHFGLPSVNKTYEEIKQCELIPFKKVIEHNVQTIMTAHIIYPQIDKENPATFSKFWLGTCLRDELSFSGVTISDDVEMKAVSDRFITEKGFYDAIDAGCDAFIISRHFYEDGVFLDSAANAYKNPPKYLKSRIMDSNERILKLFSND